MHHRTRYQLFHSGSCRIYSTIYRSTAAAVDQVCPACQDLNLVQLHQRFGGKNTLKQIEIRFSQSAARANSQKKSIFYDMMKIVDCILGTWVPNNKTQHDNLIPLGRIFETIFSETSEAYTTKTAALGRCRRDLSKDTSPRVCSLLVVEQSSVVIRPTAVGGVPSTTRVIIVV